MIKDREDCELIAEELLDTLAMDCNVHHSFELDYDDDVEKIKNISISVSGMDITEGKVVDIAEMQLTQICTNDIFDDEFCDEDDFCDSSVLKAIGNFMDCEFGGDEYVVAKNLGLFDDDGFGSKDNDELFEDMKEYIIDGNLFYIKSFVVKSKYRELGLGEKILKSLPVILKKMTKEDVVITLCAAPIEISRENKKEFQAGEDRLFEFYKRCGYTNIGENVFLKLY